MGRLLIKNTLIIPLDDKDKTGSWLKGDIAIDGNEIQEIGEKISDKKYADYEIIDGQDCLAMPGMVNCHTHGAMALLRGYADDLPLMMWLSQKIWPREAHLTEEDIYWGSQLSVLEMIKSGTTTFADMYFYMDQMARVVDEVGIRAVLSRGMIGSGDKADLAMVESEKFVKDWHGGAGGRITCLLGPHAPYTCPPDYLKEVMALSDQLGVGLHIHLAETSTEVSDIKQKYGKRPVELMNSLGLFDKRHVLAAHCVHLDKEEINLIASKQVGVAHNPESNMKLASGIAPIPDLLNEGALVGLGTDGAASNNNLDLLEEMRTCALLHKVATLDPTVLPALQVLKMATVMGAKVVGLKKTGSLQEGYKADIVLLDLHKSHLTPLHDPVANMVYASQSSDIKTVIIDGNVIMKNREMQTMDEEKVLYEAQRIGKELIIRQ